MLEKSASYRYYNVNDHNNFIDDCFPRAYAMVMDITWKEAYKEICKNSMEQGYMMDTGIFVRKFLDKKFRRIPYDEVYIGEFAENHPIGKYLITTNNHITACVNGYIIDTWNCTNEKIEYVWKIS